MRDECEPDGHRCVIARRRHLSARHVDHTALTAGLQRLAPAGENTVHAVNRILWRLLAICPIGDEEPIYIKLLQLFGGETTKLPIGNVIGDLWKLETCIP